MAAAWAWANGRASLDFAFSVSTPPYYLYYSGRAALPRPGQARPGLLRLLLAGGGHRMTCRAGLRGFLRGGTLILRAAQFQRRAVAALAE